MNTYETETNENITNVDQDCSFELRSCLAFGRLSIIFDLIYRKRTSSVIMSRNNANPHGRHTFS